MRSRAIQMFLVLAFMTASTLVARAAAVDGRWEGSVKGADGSDFALTFEFKAEGEAVAGSVESSMGKVAISNGVIKGDVLTFDVKLDDGSVIAHQATIRGDEIDVKSQGPWGEFAYTIKRVVEKAAQ